MIESLYLGRVEPWRSLLLGLGYALLLIYGVLALVQQDASGAGPIAAAVAGWLLLRRRVYHAMVWSAVAVIGVLQMQLVGTWSGPLLIVIGIGGIAAGLLDPRWGRPTTAPAPTATSVPVDAAPVAVAPVVVAPAVAARTPGPPPVARSVAVEPADPLSLRLRLLGPLSVLAGGEELASALSRAPKVAYTFLILVTWELVEGSPMSRRLLAEEGAPVLEATSQNNQLRGRLRDLRDISAALAARIEGGTQEIRLRLDGVGSDVADLRRLRAQVADANWLLGRDELAEVEAWLQSRLRSEYLNGWDALEESVARGRGSARELVGKMRAEVSRAKADLVRAYGTSMVAAGRAPAALELLESAYSQMPEDRGIADLLIEASMKAGRVDRGNDVRRHFDSGDID